MTATMPSPHRTELDVDESIDVALEMFEGGRAAGAGGTTSVCIVTRWATICCRGKKRRPARARDAYEPTADASEYHIGMRRAGFSSAAKRSRLPYLLDCAQHN